MVVDEDFVVCPVDIVDRSVQCAGPDGTCAIPASRSNDDGSIELAVVAEADDEAAAGLGEDCEELFAAAGAAGLADKPAARAGRRGEGFVVAVVGPARCRRRLQRRRAALGATDAECREECRAPAARDGRWSGHVGPLSAGREEGRAGRRRQGFTGYPACRSRRRLRLSSQEPKPQSAQRLSTLTIARHAASRPSRRASAARSPQGQ